MFNNHRKCSTSKPEFAHLPFEHDWKVPVKVSLSRKLPLPDKVLAAKIQCPTAMARETESTSPEEKPFNAARAQEIADGIRRLVLENEQLGKKKTTSQGNARSTRKPPEDAPITLPKNKHPVSPKPTDDDYDAESPSSPRSFWPETKHHSNLPFPPAQDETRRRNMASDLDSLLADGKIGNVVSSDDEISCVSELTMGTYAHLAKPMKVSRENPPPPPKRQHLHQKTLVAHPPPPPPRSTSSSLRSPIPQLPQTRRKASGIPPTLHPPPFLPDNKFLHESLSDSCPTKSSRQLESSAAKPPLPRKKNHGKSLRKQPPPPPPPRRKTVVKSKSGPGNLKCSEEEDLKNTDMPTLFSMQEKKFFDASSTVETSTKQRETCTGLEANGILGDTINIKSSAFEEYRRPCNAAPPTQLVPNATLKNAKTETASLPPKGSCHNPCQKKASDGTTNTPIQPPDDSKTKKDLGMSTASLCAHNWNIIQIKGKPSKIRINSTRQSESDESIPTPHGDKGVARFEDAAKFEKRILAENRARRSSKKPKFDKHGRCLHHPSVIMARKRVFGSGWSILQDGCQKCMQECSDTSRNRKSGVVDSNTRAVKSDSNREPTKSAQEPTVAMRRPRSRSCENHTQSVKSHTSIDKNARVSNMPYTTPWGKAGWYSGEVANGIPNGTGRMCFKNGDKYDARWINGYTEHFLEKSDHRKRGFSTSRIPWNEAITSDCSRQVKSHSFHSSDTMKPHYYQPTRPLPTYYCYHHQYGNSIYRHDDK